MTKSEHSKIYVFGASGTGSTTLGKSVAAALRLVHVDVDDHFWAPANLPFSLKRSPGERVSSMSGALGEKGWVLSGACHGWNGELVKQADLIVFMTLSTPLRLHSREKARFGKRVTEGGDMFQIHLDFIQWAKGYDNPNFNGRNIGMDERWLAAQTKPICRVNSECSPEDAVQTVMKELSAVS